MDWKDLAGTLVRTGAPIIGGALGGPLGATIGGVAGKLIADALGVAPTPEAVSTAIQNDPFAAEKLADADAKWQAMAEIAKAEATDRTEQSKAINETQRSEIASGVSWWHWRHIVGYVVILWFLIPIPAFAVLTFRYDPDAVVRLTGLIGACVPLYGFMCGLLGYIAQDSTKLKTTAITGQQAPSVSDNIITTVKTVATKIVPPKSVVVGKPIGSRD
jgi:hypothetical protein